MIQYPFSAIVGQEAMKSALLLNAVDPTIGGVLIRGQKGTAKSTAARALAALLPTIEAVKDCPYHCPPAQPELMHDGCRELYQAGESLPTVALPMPLAELPLGATEDRLAGAIDLEKTLSSGAPHFQPGLLAAANRGILYVDEVNLLEDHLVDLLLDAAASGINRVEREGLQIVHPARFLLIGTMNPEEGELRPQFLDRFGLTVTVSGLSAPAARAELVRHQLEFDRDPAAFAVRWRDEEAFLSAQISQARSALEGIEITDGAIQLATGLALELGVHGHRADIVLLKAARAFRALLGQTTVDQAAVREAAWLVLPHRLPEGQLHEPLKARERIARALGTPEAASAPQGTYTESQDVAALLQEAEFPGAAAAGSMLFETFKKKLKNG